MFPMHKHAFCVTATLLITACSKSPQPAQTTVDGQTSTSPSAAQARKKLNTLVRFINATQTPKDLYYRVAADRDVAVFTRVPFETVTPYTELPSGRPDAHHEIKLYSASNGVGVPLARNSQVENAGRRYTVLAVDEDGKPVLTVITDNLTPPASGKAKVRVIHAAPGIDKLDIFHSGYEDSIFQGVGFALVTEYKEADPGDAALAVRKRGSKTDALKIKSVKLEAGKLYTIVLLGGEGKPLNCKVIEDELLGVRSISAIHRSAASDAELVGS